MGRNFLEHYGGSVIYTCRTCKTFLSNKERRESTKFFGRCFCFDMKIGNLIGVTGRAYLFREVANLDYGPAKKSEMTTGLHFIRDVSCKICKVSSYSLFCMHTLS